MAITHMQAIKIFGEFPAGPIKTIENAANALSDFDDMGLRMIRRGKTNDDRDIVELVTKQGEILEVKDGNILASPIGLGRTVFEACQDMLKKISGKSLIEESAGSRKEYKLPVFDEIA